MSIYNFDDFRFWLIFSIFSIIIIVGIDQLHCSITVHNPKEPRNAQRYYEFLRHAVYIN